MLPPMAMLPLPRGTRNSLQASMPRRRCETHLNVTRSAARPYHWFGSRTGRALCSRTLPAPRCVGCHQSQRHAMTSQRRGCSQAQLSTSHRRRTWVPPLRGACVVKCSKWRHGRISQWASLEGRHHDANRSLHERRVIVKHRLSRERRKTSTAVLMHVAADGTLP